MASVRLPCSAHLDPPRDRLRISPGLAAQPGRLPREAFAELPPARALLDARRLGQQIGAAVRELAQLGHRSGFLSRRQLAPAGVTPCGAGNPSDEDPVSLRVAAISFHLFAQARELLPPSDNESGSTDDEIPPRQAPRSLLESRDRSRAGSMHPRTPPRARARRWEFHPDSTLPHTPRAPNIDPAAPEAMPDRYNERGIVIDERPEICQFRLCSARA
jgi:hypothetical protein